MIQELEETLKILQLFNDHKNKKIITEELAEGKADLNDFIEVKNRMKVLHNSLREVDPDNVDKVIELLIQLHLEYSDIIWHVEQVHELVKKMIGSYRNSSEINSASK